MKSKMLTLVVPTRNRPKFLARLLECYSLLNCPFQIRIADSSDLNLQGEVKQLEQTYRSRLNVVFTYYSHDPTLGPGEETTKFMVMLLEQVATPYVVFNQDDDIFIPGTLEKCVYFLENNCDYSLAHGVGILMSVENGQPYGRILGTSEYPQQSYELPKAQDRFLHYTIGKGTTGQFSVKRTRQSLEAWGLAYRFGLDNYFEEHFNNSFSAIQGKFKKIEELYLIRQTHPAMTSRVKRFLDWVIHPSFSKNYHDFLVLLSKELVKVDNLTEEEAQEIIRKGFWYCLSDTSLGMWNGTYMQQPLKTRVKKLVRSSKISSMRQWIHSFFPGNKLTLSALLSASSPFHNDFLPIYNAISSAPFGWEVATQKKSSRLI